MQCDYLGDLCYNHQFLVLYCDDTVTGIFLLDCQSRQQAS